MSIRFEKTAYGWYAYQRQGGVFVYFGHFRTQREAREALKRPLDYCDSPGIFTEQGKYLKNWLL